MSNISKAKALILAMKQEDEFKMWMVTNKIKYGLTDQNIADKLHMTRQTVTNHYSGRSSVPFVYCMAYCALFGNEDDPEKIWKMANDRNAP